MAALTKNDASCEVTELIKQTTNKLETTPDDFIMSYGKKDGGDELDAKVYIGGIGRGTVKQELEDKFGRYGPIKSVWIARNPPGFAFVVFEDPRDAEDAVYAMDGQTINRRTARVEMSSGKSRWKGKPPPSGRYRDSRGPPPRHRRSRSRSRSPPHRRPKGYSRSRSRSRSNSPMYYKRS